MRDELGGNIKLKVVRLKAKTYSYLINYSSEDKKEKDTKKYVRKKLEFENYKNCLEAIQIKNEIKPLEENEIGKDSLKKNHKQFIKNNK